MGRTLDRGHCLLMGGGGGEKGRGHCSLAMFPEGGQTKKHCFPPIDIVSYIYFMKFGYDTMFPSHVSQR